MFLEKESVVIIMITITYITRIVLTFRPQNFILQKTFQKELGVVTKAYQKNMFARV